jgi:hypothetical protein
VAITPTTSPIAKRKKYRAPVPAMSVLLRG